MSWAWSLELTSSITLCLPKAFVMASKLHGLQNGNMGAWSQPRAKAIKGKCKEPQTEDAFLVQVHCCCSPRVWLHKFDTSSNLGLAVTTAYRPGLGVSQRCCREGGREEQREKMPAASCSFIHFGGRLGLHLISVRLFRTGRKVNNPNPGTWLQSCDLKTCLLLRIPAWSPCCLLCAWLIPFPSHPACQGSCIPVACLFCLSWPHFVSFLCSPVLTTLC